MTWHGPVDLSGALEARDSVKAAEAILSSAVARRDEALYAYVTGTELSMRDVAELFGVSHQRVSQICKAQSALLLAGLPKVTKADRLREAREAFRLAQYAQEMRCEAYAMGYAEETAAFYGSEKVAQSDDAEQRIGWAGFYKGADAELADVS